MADALKRHLQLASAYLVGDPNKVITRAVVVGGKGFKADSIPDVLNQGVTCILQGNLLMQMRWLLSI